MPNPVKCFFCGWAGSRDFYLSFCHGDVSHLPVRVCPTTPSSQGRTPLDRAGRARWHLFVGDVGLQFPSLVVSFLNDLLLYQVMPAS